MRYPRTTFSSCAAECTRPCSSSVASSTRSATRVTARTLEYDNFPAANASPINGSPLSAVATRTYSRAAPGPTEHDQDSQFAADRIPHCTHPLRRLNSATNANHSRVSAANRAAIDVIRPSNTSNDSAQASSGGSAVGASPASGKGVVSSNGESTGGDPASARRGALRHIASTSASVNSSVNSPARSVITHPCPDQAPSRTGVHTLTRPSDSARYAVYRRE